MSPITLCIKVSQIQARLFPQRDIRRSPRNFPRHKSPSPPWALVVEQDPVASEHTVRLTVVDDDPVRVELCTAIWRARVERSGFALRSLDNLAVQLGGGCLVEFDMFFETAGAHSIKETEGAQPVDITSVFCHLKGDLDMRLRTEVVDLGRLDLSDDVDEVGAVTQVTIVQFKSAGI